MPTIALRKVSVLGQIYEAVWIDDIGATHIEVLTAQQYADLALVNAGAPPGVPAAIWALGPSRAIALVRPRYSIGATLAPGDVVPDQTIAGVPGFVVKLRTTPGTFVDAIFVSPGLGDTVEYDGTGLVRSVTPAGGTFPAKCGVVAIKTGKVTVR